MSTIQLRNTKHADLEQLFLFQLDEEACYLAAFMSKDHQDKDAYMIKFTKLLNDKTVNNYTILVNDVIVGSIAKYMMDGQAEITYWIDKQYWGQGIASTALSQFLEIETTRPIYGHVAFDNIGSQKVLEKCNFIKVGTSSGFSNKRNTNVEEYVYELRPSTTVE